MIIAWSDSDTSDSENDEEHTTNTCLTAIEWQDHEHEKTNEVDIAALYECSKDELINALVSFAKLNKDVHLNIKISRETFKN